MHALPEWCGAFQQTTHPLLVLAGSRQQASAEHGSVVQGVVRCVVRHILQCDLLWPVISAGPALSAVTPTRAMHAHALQAVGRFWHASHQANTMMAQVRAVSFSDLRAQTGACTPDPSLVHMQRCVCRLLRGEGLHAFLQAPRQPLSMLST